MSAKLEVLSQKLQDRFGGNLESVTNALGELTIEIAPCEYYKVMQVLRDEQDFSFEELIDLCGVDYLSYGEGARSGKRFATVVHLLSIVHNALRGLFEFKPQGAAVPLDEVESAKEIGLSIARKAMTGMRC